MSQTKPAVNSHILGYPRIGDKRQTKFALEKYWAGKQDKATTQAVLQQVLTDNLQAQLDAGLSVLTTGDFVPYDLVLSQAVAFGICPQRFTDADKLDVFDRQFYLARGRAPQTEHTPDQEHISPSCCQHQDTAALQMTKWFDTNYHYLVPELDRQQIFTTNFDYLYQQIDTAKAMLADKGVNKPIKAVLVGPLSFLYLSTSQNTDKLAHLDAIIPAYCEVFQQLGKRGVTWVQIDEPILSLDLASDWQQAFERTYHQLQLSNCAGQVKLLLTSYFDTLGNNCNLVCNLPVAGIHIDITRTAQAKQYVNQVVDHLPSHKVLSVGVVDGRSVWTTNLTTAQDVLAPAYDKLGDRLWVGTGSSLLHLPVDLGLETVPAELQGKLAFAKQKLAEVVTCAKLATGETQPNAVATQIQLNDTVSLAKVREGEFSQRYQTQQDKLKLPLFPTTTIGSFPQTSEIRKARAAWRKGNLSDTDYTHAMQLEIANAIAEQEALGLDVLVHGEAERTDMVEYFAQYLNGFWLANNGWVQSYGTRCVRPPIVTGNISRPTAMTVDWINYAQQHTKKPVKGMLTGPVTILNWSFAPSDVASRDLLRMQLADAINQEVNDLQQSGVAIIQIDEPAFREGLPLKQAAQTHYWQAAVQAFKHSCSSAKVETQIHTHMCYSSFHDCLTHIAAMDADVITIETARSGLQLLDAFKKDDNSEGYSNAIGPGVYDIHSPRTPAPDNMQVVIDEAIKYIPKEHLWVNPDCGLKTRGWAETRSALANMVAMTKTVRQQYVA